MSNAWSKEHLTTLLEELEWEKLKRSSMEANITKNPLSLKQMWLVLSHQFV